MQMAKKNQTRAKIKSQEEKVKSISRHEENQKKEEKKKIKRGQTLGGKGACASADG